MYDLLETLNGMMEEHPTASTIAMGADMLAVSTAAALFYDRYYAPNRASGANKANGHSRHAARIKR